MQCLLKRITCACLLIAGFVAPVNAQLTPTDGVPLSLLAAQNMDTGSVMLYSVANKGPNNERQCLGMNQGAVSISNCDFNQLNQKWLLDSSHQIRSQKNPSQCVYWGSSGDALRLQDCMAVPDATQIFLFQRGNAIANLGAQKCIQAVAGSGYPISVAACNGGSAAQQFRMQSQSGLYQILSTISNTSYVHVADASSTTNSQLTTLAGAGRKTLNEYWYVTPAENGEVYIQNLQTGYCLSNYSGNYEVVDVCRWPGDNASQRWLLAGGLMKNVGTGRCYGALTAWWGGVINLMVNCGDDSAKKVQLQNFQTPLNFAMIGADRYSNATCLGPYIDGSSTLSQNVVTRTCTSKAEKLASAVDYMPDQTLRFRATGQCLELTGNFAKQNTCLTADQTPKVTQQWLPVDIGFMVPVAFGTGYTAQFRVYDRVNVPDFSRIGWRSANISTSFYTAYFTLTHNLSSTGDGLFAALTETTSESPEDVYWYAAPVGQLLANPCYSLTAGPQGATAQCTADATYYTAAWAAGPDGQTTTKFRYGAYSTLASTLMLRLYYPSLIGELNDESSDNTDYTGLMKYLKAHYASFQNLDFLRLAPDAHYGNVFEPWRTAIPIGRPDVNRAFMTKMSQHPELEPVDFMVSNNKFTAANMQYNAHRGAYNIGLGVPDNSLAAILAAYLAGIRSVEFDVLQTADSQNVVVHDLNTNRLNSNYGSPGINVETMNWGDIKNTPTTIPNPVGSTAAGSAPTGINMMMKTEHVLNFIHKYMPEMTVYIDARNNAPASVLEILHRHPEYVNNVVLKIYPFTLKGGGLDLVAVYAKVRNAKAGSLAVPFSIADYTNKNDAGMVAAANELAKIKTNVLLALGSAGEQAQAGAEIATVGVSYDDFNTAQFNSLAPNLWFSPSADFISHYPGVYSVSDLSEIQDKTFKMFKWAASFAGITKTVVLQIGLLPSMRRSLSLHNGTYDNSMDRNSFILSAVNDNFMYLYLLTTAHGTTIGCQNALLQIHVDDLSTNMSTNLGCLWNSTVFGFSDRYPDYSFAMRKPDGSVDTATVRDFLYKMDGTVYENNGYAARKMRSSAAVGQMIADIEDADVPVQYVTTDMPEDLRTAAMGMLGTTAGFGLPADINYRPGAIIKSALTPASIPTWRPPSWSTSLPLINTNPSSCVPNLMVRC